MITNGSVKYTLPAAYAENRPGSEVTLCFAVPDGSELTYAESFLAYTADTARSMAYKLQRGEAVVQDQASHTVAGPAIADAKETAAAKGRRTRATATPTPGPTLAEAAASLVEAAQSLPGSAPATATAPTPAIAASPLPVPGGNVVPLLTAAGPSIPQATVAVPAATPTAPVVGPTSVGATALSTDAIVAAISDETLGQKVTGKLTEMRDILGVAQDVAVAKIHAVIQQFTGMPQGRLVDIAVAQREAFVTTLNALS